MYPSKKDPLFGVFVKNFKVLLEEERVDFIAMSVIKGKRNNKLAKGLTYFKHFLSVTKNYIIKTPDLIYVHYISNNSIILALLLFLRKSSPIVVNVHGSDVSDSEGKLMDRFNKYVLKKTDLVVVPSDYFKKVILNRYKFLDASKVYVSPSGGIDTSKFYPTEKNNNTPPVIGLVSRIDVDKGWDDFLKALYKVKKKGVKFKVKIAGQGLEEALLKKLILKLKLEKEINFIGLINQNHLVALYNEIDVLVFPTRKAESLGLVGLEAMSCKTPVIGSNSAGIKTYIKHKENGFLFEPGNIDDLTLKICDFLALSSNETDIIASKALETGLTYEAKYVAKALIQELSQLCIKN